MCVSGGFAYIVGQRGSYSSFDRIRSETGRSTVASEEHVACDQCVNSLAIDCIHDSASTVRSAHVALQSELEWLLWRREPQMLLFLNHVR